MSWPWLFNGQFETGDASEFTSETDTQSKLNIRTYYDLVRRLPTLPDPLPFRGGYACHIDLSLGTADAYLQEDTAFDTALAGTIWVRFLVQVSSNLVMATSDRFTLFALQSGAGTDEATIGIINNAGTVQWVASETGTTAVGAGTRLSDVTYNAWHTMEMGCVIDSGGNNGVIQFFVDGYQIGANITGLTQAAITQAQLGAIGIDAGTTAGHLLFDQVVADDTRIYGFSQRYPAVVALTKSGVVLPGPGRFRLIRLDQGAAADNVVQVYDTDVATTPPEHAHLAPILNSEVANREFRASRHDGHFSRGLRVAMSGTSPRVLVALEQGLVSPGLIRAHALQRPIPGPVW